MKALIYTLFLIPFGYEADCQVFAQQAFLMKMQVRETKEDTKEYLSYVYWGMDEKGSLCFLIDSTQELIYLSKLKWKYMRKYNKEVKNRVENFRVDKANKRYSNATKVNDLFIDANKRLFHVYIYLENGMLIWITRIDEKLPCYMFTMTK